MFCFMSSAAWSEPVVAVDERLDYIISSASMIDNPGDRIVALSNHFLGTSYAANTLVGGPQEPEHLVVNLNEFDCFTLLDVIEALRRTSATEEFPEKLISVRYFDNTVAYVKRRHFFSDWVVGNVIADVTTKVGQGRSQNVSKQLNRKSDGSLWLSGLPVTPREIDYIPGNLIDFKVLSALLPGDYIGVYSDQDGLDVSHTGLIVKGKGNVMLRHASSRSGMERVIDDDLLEYFQGKAGMVVYRIKPQ
jgi:hypothetical protein